MQTRKHIFNTNSELSQNCTEKQIIPSKTTINWLFNDIWSYLLIAYLLRAMLVVTRFWGSNLCIWYIYMVFIFLVYLKIKLVKRISYLRWLFFTKTSILAENEQNLKSWLMISVWWRCFYMVKVKFHFSHQCELFSMP